MTGSQRHRPVTVDRDAETDILDELATVSQDRTTANKVQVITFCYPADTPFHISRKLAKKRKYKSMNQPILIGRGMDVDVMLNEEHIPRLFAQVQCRCDHNVESQWYLKNMTEKKQLCVYSNGLRRLLKLGDEVQLQDGCEVNLDVLTLVIKIDEGDLYSRQGFEVEVRQVENDSSNSSSREAINSCSRKASGRSTTTYNSVASAQGRGRQGSASAKGSDKRSVQYPCPEPSHFVDPAPVVQHLVHYCPNVFPPGSPGSTCCLHHHPYGCPQQQQQQCYACHPSGAMSPTMRKQNSQDGGLPTQQNVMASGSVTGLGFFPREETVAVSAATPMMTQGPYEASQAGLPVTHELFSGPGNMMMQPMYQASELASRPGYALPELYGMVPNTTFLYGPSAFHPLHHPMQQPQQMLGSYACFQPEATAQPEFANVLRRSQSMFTRQMKRPEHRHRRSSCDGAQLTPQLVTQPESAQMGLNMQHGFSEPDVSSIALHETAQKVYHIPGKDAASQSTQIDSLKFGSAVLAALSPNTTAASTFASSDMYHENIDSWDVVDDCKMTFLDDSKMTSHSVRAEFRMNNRHPVESISHMLPSTAGFSSSSSGEGEEGSWKSATAPHIHCSLRQPQENDERQPEGHYVQHQRKLLA
ncbi:hypothetical protein ACOMHN_016877 [Nucella lapillus]